MGSGEEQDRHMTILILQPIRPSNPPALRERADALLSRLEGANPGLVFDICQDDSAVDAPPHPSLYVRHAAVRNYMLDTYLRPEHTHVLWIDSDLIDYPATLPNLLMGVNDGGITAPFAMLDKWPNRFYDIGGFIEKGSRARMWPPYFDQDGAVIELDSVGCCYLAPADLYRDVWVPFRTLNADGRVNGSAARYSPPPTDYYVEHWSVMQEAKRRGLRIVALRDVQVVHAWLPDYGLGLN
jgi:hypothetical protein